MTAHTPMFGSKAILKFGVTQCKWRLGITPTTTFNFIWLETLWKFMCEDTVYFLHLWVQVAVWASGYSTSSQQLILELHRVLHTQRCQLSENSISSTLTQIWCNELWCNASQCVVLWRNALQCNTMHCKWCFNSYECIMVNTAFLAKIHTYGWWWWNN